MATSCFCGCGRGVDRSRRGINKQGRRTAGLIAKLKDAHAEIEAWHVKRPEQAFELAVAITEITPDDFDEIKRRDADQGMPEGKATITVIADAADELIESGESYLSSWTNIVHGENDYALYDAQGFKTDWETWGKQGMTLCRLVGVPISRVGVFTGNV